MTETPSSSTISTKLQRVAKLAREAPGLAFTTLAHHLDLEWLREAHRRTRKDGAVGVDGVRAEDYARDLEANLQSLLDRAKSGTYRAPPVRRVHIPKGSDPTRTRPIGIPTFEDKVLQRAVAMLLEAIYEQDFLDCSYGFRPGRSAHQALKAVDGVFWAMGGGWVLEIDIERFFDTLGVDHLRTMLHQRVRDGVVLRLIDKWLHAGVFEAGAVTHPDAGTPQGGVISPLLANVYLHEVLDRWFHERVMPRLQGRAQLIRYADDAVLIFSEEQDARRVMDVLPKRFGRYGLTLHPMKTRLVAFQRPDRVPPDEGGAGPGSSGHFDLLGFTHVWKRSRRGFWVVKRSTAKDRFSRVLNAIRALCRRQRHEPIRTQGEALSQRLRGHFGYFGIVGNSQALARFAEEVGRIWHRWLERRGSGPMLWERFDVILKRFPLPSPKMPIQHAARP
jgi:hypothetical protein